MCVCVCFTHKHCYQSVYQSICLFQSKNNYRRRLRWWQYADVNAHKTEYMCYNQTGDISTLGGTSLKLVDKFANLGSSVSSTEKDIDTRLTKAWTALDHMEIRPDR